MLTRQEKFENGMHRCTIKKNSIVEKKYELIYNND